jgi:hypothetical protein
MVSIDSSYPPQGEVKPSWMGSQSETGSPPMDVEHADTANIPKDQPWWNSAPSGGGIGDIRPNISGASRSRLRNRFDNRGNFR